MNFRFLAKKMIAVEKRIAKEKGPLNLFALFEREDSPGHLDVIVAADWAFRDEWPTREYLTEVFEEGLERDEDMALSAVGILDPDEENVRSIAQFAEVEHGLVELRDEDIWGVTVRRAYFITCKWPAARSKTRKARKVPKAATKRAPRRRTTRERTS